MKSKCLHFKNTAPSFVYNMQHHAAVTFKHLIKNKTFKI